ncbi:exodeoxyribonuclease VII small subunit [Cutibacterium sp.]|uniref:exodeoxyribonuclease VII small subunit n=1 Tax=Cutibacterium sp. TaxID=1912221 RepID=UPI0026DC988C|nr:exodeoxyribonuclease VII small subunit [Cutibacterium sp.]MDO4411479.1 exodeoxyribonuclease VII small subunit [Cutibacterium sp.]
MSEQQGESTTPEPEIPYEAARDELVSIVAQLESGGISLAETMKLWERGEKLADICQTWLDGARSRIEAAQSEAENRPDSANVTKS